MKDEESKSALPTKSPEQRSPTHVVGIGASAGGLESLELLFQNMKPNSGMAFVVIQHLSPDFKSMMSELLARHTSMKIVVVDDGIRVEADTIYLIPPKKQMIIADGCLHLTAKDSSTGLTLPIDHFFHSLALDSADKTIAIILSGTGTDGTRGIKSISQSGGLVISESLDTAKFDGMPASAQATDLVDLVLAPSGIGKALAGYCDDPISLPRGKIERDQKVATLTGVEAIFQLFKNVYDIDFASYKDSTVMRRIRRRLAMSSVDTLDQYADVLRSTPDELHALYVDLLIGVTQFFRDSEVFDYLERNVLRTVIDRRKDGQAVRAWVCGCATGEEAYSIAIVMKEVMRVSGQGRPIKIFATDVHKRSIEHASRGVFDEQALSKLPKELLDRYFTQRTEGYQVSSEIRQMIVFAPHNVLRDAPFTDLDFISCRNMLIYFRPAAQRRAISLFHYGLGTDGILLLGSSESTGELANEFEVISDRHRLYRKHRDVRLTHNLRSPLTSADSVHQGVPTNALGQCSVISPPPGPTRTRQLHDELLNRFMPPSIMIDRSRVVIDTFGGAERLLNFPSRRPSLDVLDLIDSEIRTTLSGAIGRAVQNQSTVRFEKLVMQVGGDPGSYHLTVDPVSGKGDKSCYLITFEPLEESGESQASQNTIEDASAITETPTNGVASEQIALLNSEDVPLEFARQQVRQLEGELRYSRENLQATIEELETSNEEMQATNEELIASNEELQSTNEELHSLNEELYSVNSEHQRKIEELAVLNRDMNHLLENTEVAIMFLDNDLKIRRFTSQVCEVFELIDEDVGRSIHVFGSKLRLDNLVEKLRTVLQTGEPIEQEVRSDDGTSYLMRMLAYRIDDRICGVVMMWVDVSSLEVLRGRLRWLSAIVESTNDAIIGQDLQGHITSWNRGAEQLYGYIADEIVGKSMEGLVPDDRQHEVTTYRDHILEGKTVLSTDTIRKRRDGTSIHVQLTVSPVLDDKNQVIGISKIARDIGERITMEQEIRRQVQQRERFLAMLSHELRNPLNAVSTATAILENGRATGDQKSGAVATLGRQVALVKHLLADLLDVARVAENRIVLKFEQLDMRELVPEITEIVGSELQRHGCSVEFDVPDHPLMLNGDRARLIQVQVNLIHNAAKYSESPNPIRVTMQDEGNQIHLCVVDDGKGIPPENLESIFEPFAQLERSSNRGDGGLGVGLTLARSLVELHGGTISAESDGEGCGTVFRVVLKSLTESDRDLANAASTDSLVAAQADSIISATDADVTRAALRICVVEDMADSRTLLQQLLQLQGHQVSTAANGAEAIEMLTSEPFDCALVDIGLPDMSGYQVARRVRDNGSSEELTLIALTGYGQPGDIESALAAGFDDHFVKPVDVDQLMRICSVKAKETLSR